MKEIDIEYRTIQVPVKIVVGETNYPITQWNREVIAKYEVTKDESILEDLKDFSLEL